MMSTWRLWHGVGGCVSRVSAVRGWLHRRWQRPFMRCACRRACVVTLLLAVAGLIWWSGAHRLVSKSAEGRIYRMADSVPQRKVALVLGCSRLGPSGLPNRYFTYRIAAAAELYKAGKVEYVLVSGDNHTRSYDEPTDMKEALMEAGVPENCIVCDYAGFSTFDSVIRAKAVFGEENFIIVSQPFHVRRALFVAHANGIEAIGYCARDVSLRGGIKTRIREQLAVMKAAADAYALEREPRFYGPRVMIGSPHSQVEYGLP